MNDSIILSFDCLDKAEHYASTTAEQDSLRLNQWLNDYGDLGGYKFSDRQRISQYRKQLEERLNEIQRLNILHQ